MEQTNGNEPMLHDSSILIGDDEELSAEPTSQCSIDNVPTVLYDVSEVEASPQMSVYLFAHLQSNPSRVGNGLVSTSDNDLLFQNEPVQVKVVAPITEPSPLSSSSLEVAEFFTALPVSDQTTKLTEHVESANNQNLPAADVKENSESDPEDMIRRYVVGANEPSTSHKQTVTRTIPHETNKQKPQDVIIVTTDSCKESSEDLYNKSDEVTITLDKSDIVTANQIEHKNHKRISNSGTSFDPILNMSCEIITHFEKNGGWRREVTTQTSLPKKAKVSKKRKQEKNKIAFVNKNPDNDFINSDKEEEINIMKCAKLKESVNEKPFRCSKCSLRFRIQTKVELHEKCHIENSPLYKCFKCPKIASQWIKMYQHLFTHGIEKPHKCPHCSFTCISQSDVNSHMAVHSETKDWLCEKCNRPFKHRRNMVAHQRTCPGLDDKGKPKAQDSSSKSICIVCKRELSNPKNLAKHMEIHRNLKPFVCDICGHSTRLKESLVMHKRLHTGEKPYKCNQCDYATPDKSSLRRHKRRHSNEKPYACNMCNYKCIQKHCLNTHIRRKHTGEQFVCGLCHYATHDRYGLNQHFKKHQVDKDEGGLQLSANNSTAAETTEPDSKSNDKNTENVKQNEAEIGVVLQLEESSIVGTASFEPKESNLVLVESSEKDSENKNVTKLELSGVDCNILQEIHQEGDEIFIQDNGHVLIQRKDGRILVLQFQEETTESSLPNQEKLLDK